jgi:hypothetical protein
MLYWVPFRWQGCRGGLLYKGGELAALPPAGGATLCGGAPVAVLATGAFIFAALSQAAGGEAFSWISLSIAPA